MENKKPDRQSCVSPEINLILLILSSTRNTSYINIDSRFTPTHDRVRLPQTFTQCVRHNLEHVVESAAAWCRIDRKPPNVIIFEFWFIAICTWHFFLTRTQPITRFFGCIIERRLQFVQVLNRMRLAHWIENKLSLEQITKFFYSIIFVCRFRRICERSDFETFEPHTHTHSPLMASCSCMNSCK